MPVTPPAVLRVWDAMTHLRAPAPERHDDVVVRGLDDAAHLVRTACGVPGDTRRPVPSAGAVFPYEPLALCPVDAPGGPRWACFRVADPTRPVRVDVPPGGLPDLAARFGGADTCHVLLVLRPWASMRRYGPRGYLYALVDAAHAATNLWGVARHAHGDAVLRLVDGTLPDVPAGLVPPFHELHSVVSFRAGPPAARRVAVADAPAGRVSQDEEAAWREVVAPLGHGAAPGAVRDVPVVPVGTPGVPLVAQWPRWAAARRSARALGGAPPRAGVVADVVAAVAEPLRTDVAGGHVQVSVVDVGAGWSDADRAVLSRTARVHRPSGVSRDDVLAGCVGQRHVADARVFVVLHAAARDVLGAGERHAVRPAVFRAGAASQLVYLAAARAGVGVLAVGGFVQGVWRHLVGLPDVEVLGVLAVGGDPGGGAGG